MPNYRAPLQDMQFVITELAGLERLAALPGYEEVGRRRVLLGCWGAFQDAQNCDYRYDHMTDWGRQMKVTPEGRCPSCATTIPGIWS